MTTISKVITLAKITNNLYFDKSAKDEFSFLTINKVRSKSHCKGHAITALKSAFILSIKRGKIEEKRLVLELRSRLK